MNDVSLAPPRAASVSPAATSAPARGYHVEIFVISFSSLLLEIAYTRVISFKLFYYYTYLVIGLALLGIGSGAVLVAVSGRLRRASTEAVIMWGLLLGAASVGAGYVVLALTPVATLDIWDYGSGRSLENIGRLVVICLALFESFVAVGVMIATLFGRGSAGIGRLYFADLLGAGLACATVVALVGRVGAPATVFLAGLLLALCGLRVAARRRSRAMPVAAALALAMAVAVVSPGILPDQRVDTIKTQLNDANTSYTAWSPVFRVDAVQFPDRVLLYHDGLPGSAIYPFDGDLTSLGRFDTDPRSLPFSIDASPPGNVMIVGAAGGHEILASLYFDAGHIDAVELNPATHSLLTGRFADYAGHIAERPNVNYVVGDGRSFLARSHTAYDLVWFPAPDSYAVASSASASALVLSESYLYTSEAVEESLGRLAPNGIVAAQFGEVNYAARPNRTTRYVSTARHALAALGIDDPTGHIIVATTPTDLGGGTVSTILVKRDPFTAAEVDSFTRQLTTLPGGAMQYAPGWQGASTTVSAVVTVADDRLDAWYDAYPYDVRPVLDDSPFFWHFSRFSTVVHHFGDSIDRDQLEVATGERVLLLLLGIAAVMAAVFLLLPFLAVREVWAGLPGKRRSALYFASLGFGFMFFEITLIQRMTLFLGYPTYSLTVTLASILSFTGLGALLSERWTDESTRTIPVLTGAITVLTAFYLVGLPRLTDALLSWPLGARVAVTFLVLAPLGICLGMFMPLGLGAVAASTDHPREYVAWGWAVNGFASVLGAVLTTILAMTFGFRVVLVLALAVYLVAIAVLRGLRRPAGRPHPRSGAESRQHVSNSGAIS